MARKVYRSKVNQLKHEKRILTVVIIVLALINIGQAVYTFKVAPSNEVIKEYKNRLSESNEKVHNLEKQLKATDQSYEQISFENN